MQELSVSKFKSNLKGFVDKAINDHEPLKVKRRNGRDFIIVPAEDWEREQETLYVLQNTSLMKQIQESLKTHKNGSGYQPKPEELNEIARI